MRGRENKRKGKKETDREKVEKEEKYESGNICVC